jgi:hypothetical protein
MTDPEPELDRTGSAGNLDRATGTPRWVKIFALALLVLVLLVAVLHLTGNAIGGHA